MALGLFRNNSGRKPAPAVGDRFLELDGREVAVKVSVHPRATRITLRVQPGGGLKVTMPPHVSEASLDRFLERNRAWAAARISRLPQAVKLAEGALIPYLGVDHRIVHLDRMRGVVEAKLVAGDPSLLVPGEPSHVGRKLTDFLKKRARAELNEAVMRHSRALDVRARQIRITDTTSRWGSCSTTRTLSFSWRIIMAPPEVLDYLAAHEVAHLREMNHSDRFWNLVRQICPEMDAHKAWLKANGHRLHAVEL
jgi:predicted metal-dependent hydrolase